MEVGLVKKIDIDAEMKESYLNYAMSVIVSRALPDARDGLKPVQRRILYAMHDMKMRPDTAYKKSARVVGEVLGKYHPHGDQSVYDAMVRMAQNFSVRYPLVDGQGNFGSIDGDAAAAMRYTEARMHQFGFDMMTDIERDTVNYTTNFDDSLEEPIVLPAVIPNLLVNGCSGIAVGMSTSIPPHNLVEVVQAVSHLLENWEQLDDITSVDLLEFVQGPDFPTGGLVFRYRDSRKHPDGKKDALVNAYSTGKGRITVRAKIHVEEMERNKNRLVITEIPYQTNKTNLLSRIATLHRDGRLSGLTDLRDETDRNGIRIVLETTRNVEVEDVLADLYKYTPLQSTFSINMVSLVDGEPKVLNLKQLLLVYIEHRLEIIRRRSEYDLRQARERAHVLEGLLVALDNLDEIIDAIRRSRSTDTARKNLMKKFELTQTQAQAILDMPLRRLASMERKKIKDEYKERRAEISRLEDLLSSPAKMRGTIQEELEEIVEKYADRRRSRLVDLSDSDVSVPRDLVPDEDAWIMIGEKGTAARTNATNVTRIAGKVEEMPQFLMQANTQDYLYLITADGEAACVPVHQLPPVSEYGRGAHWAELTPLTRRKHVAAAVIVPRSQYNEAEGYITMATLGGTVKRIRVEDLPPGPSPESFTVMRVDSGDSLGWAQLTTGEDEILLATAVGYAIRFEESEVRPYGLSAGGVAGVKLKGDADGVVSMQIVQADGQLWSVLDNGMGKRTPMDEYPTQGRNGQGVINLRPSDGAVEVVTAVCGAADLQLLLKVSTGAVRPMKLSKAKDGPRNITPTPITRTGARTRVVGVVPLLDATLDEEPDIEQLSLIDED